MTLNTKIVSAFCGVGKTHFCEANSKVIEFECWKYQGEDFPKNYVKDIKSAIGKYRYIFISTNPIGLKALHEEGLDITLIYPNIDLKYSYINRYKKRNSPESFIQMIDDNWNAWIYELHQQTYCKQIELDDEKYLSDILN